MNKKIITLGIIGMFLLVGIATASTSDNISLSTVSVEKPENITPNGAYYKHIKGNGTGIAFQFGSILIAFAERGTVLKLEYYYYDNPEEIIKIVCTLIIQFRFDGELIKQGDGTFDFEGDGGLCIYNM